MLMNGNLSIADINSKIEEAQDLRAEMERREASSTSVNVEVIPYLDDSTTGEDNNNIGKPAGSLMNYRSENVLNLQIIAFKKSNYCKISHLKTKYCCKISHFTKNIRTFAPFKDT